MKNAEQQVANYYTRGKLEEKIASALGSAGKNFENLRADDLALLDEFHLGGLEATQALAELMQLRFGMHLLDVGCGIGGPARYFAQRGCQVTGIDLTEEFVQVAESLTRKLRLDDKAKFRRASGLEIPFEAHTFDGAYSIHVGMNIADKAGVFREVARVLKPGARFTIFDIMRVGEGELAFPLPWALSPETSFVAGPNDYRQALEAAGFRIDHQRDLRQFALEVMEKMQPKDGAAPPVLGVHILMGVQAPLMLKNVNTAIVGGVLSPVEVVAVRKKLAIW